MNRTAASRAPRVTAALLLAAGACLLHGALSADHVTGAPPAAPGRQELLKALMRRTPSIDAMTASGEIRVIDTYGADGSLLLVEGDRRALGPARGGGRHAEVREVPDRIRLRSRTIDTSGRSASTPARHSAQGHLEIVQFHGPIKADWLARMRGAGRSRPVAYVPHNAYIVWTDDPVALGSAGLPLQWREEYAPADRLSPELGSSALPGDVTIQVAREGNHDELIEEIRGRALAVLEDAHDVGPVTNIRVTMPAGAVEDLAGRAEVVWIEPLTPVVTHDEKSALIAAGLIDKDTPSAPGYLAWLDAHDLGDLGSIIVDVTDTGIGNGSTTLNHAGLQGRIAYSVDATGEGILEDCPGHGTNVAGIIAGGAQPGNLLYDSGGYLGGLGVAPTVQVGASRIFDCANRTTSAVSYAQIVAQAYARGARIGNNSWGGGGSQYNTVTAEYDALVRDANLDPNDGDQEFLPVFSVGNLGSRSYSIGWPATAKNVLSVGGTEGYRPGVTDGCGAGSILADNVNHVLSFSSRGPTADGRIKPDLVAPGSHIISLASNAPDYTGVGACNRYYPPGQQVLNWASGTSQAAAHATGAAAIALEIYRRWFGADPSPAMLKAVLINHAHDMGSTTTLPTNTTSRPNNSQGWGRVDISSVVEAKARVAIDQTTIFTGTGDSVSYGPLVVDDPSQPIVVTLAWTDAPGTPAGSAWVNDLDLSVEAAGQTYLGNVMSFGLSVPGGTADFRNNVENVVLGPGQTSLRVHVLASDIVGDGVPSHPGETDQDFALYVSNAHLPGPDASLTLHPDAAVCGSTLEVNVADARMRGAGRATVTLSSGSDSETASLDEIPAGLSLFRGGIDVGSGPAVPGDGILQVADAQPVLASYIHPDPATGAPVVRTASVTSHCSAPVISDVRVIRKGSFEATVVWKTDRPADSTVYFGPGSSRNEVRTDPMLVKDHRVRLVGLKPCSLITATVASTDAWGATATGPAAPLRFASGQGTNTRRIVFHDDMESLGSRWEHHAMSAGAVDDWQLGFPTVGTAAPPAGSQVWGTNLDGIYSVGADAVLTSPEIDLTDVVAPQLSIIHYFSISGGQTPFSLNDGGWVEITSDGGATWTGLDPTVGYPDSVDPDNPWLPDGAPVYAGSTPGWTQADFDLASFSGSVVQVRFHFWQDPTESVPRFAGWYIDDFRIAAQETCHIGLLSFDADEYGCSSRPVVALTDTDLNLSATAVDTATVMASGAGGNLPVVLQETGANTGDFRGVLALSPVAMPGALAVGEGDQINVVYDDANTGDGTPATETASALVADCTPPPVPASVQASPDGAGRLSVSWAPIDPAAAPDLQGYRIYYDTDGPGPTYSGTGAFQGLSPVRTEALPATASLTTLSACTPYFIAVSSFDRFGNESAFSAESLGFPDGSTPCTNGRLEIGPADPGCGDTINVQVADANADTDPLTSGTIQVTATSPSHAGTVTVSLQETTPSSGVFVGAIQLANAPQPGALTVASGDPVNVEYVDLVDGLGGSTTVGRQLTIDDCTAPVITDVRVLNPGSDRGIIAWTTDEPSDSTLRFGPDPALGSSITDPGLKTRHAIPITGLDACSPVYFTVTSSDIHGNETTATDAGLPFLFGTSRDIPIFYDDFESGAPGWTHQSLGTAIDEWELGAPQGDGTRAPAAAWSGSSVYGTDLDGVYERGADAVLVSPPIALLQGDAATLVFRHWYDITSVGAPQGYDDGGFLEISQDDGATWTYIQPIPPGYPDIVTPNPYAPFGAGAYAGSTGAWREAAFPLDQWIGQTVRLRFHLFQDVVDHNFTGQGWYIDDVDIHVSLACHQGRVRLDPAEYGCGGAVLTARVTDQDLDLDPLAADNVTVRLLSDAEPAGESLLLTEITPSSGVFEGSAPVSGIDAPGTLKIQEADTIRLEYLDEDDGTGQPATMVATARVTDCTPPVISDVQALDATADSFRVRWTTSEPADGAVLYGTDASYGSGLSSPALTTEHDFTVTGLDGCTAYNFTVVSTDASGNTARDDDQSGPRLFSTRSPVVVLRESFDNGAPGWSHEGQGDTWSFGAPSLITPPSSPAVAAISLAGDYARPPGPDGLDFILVSPSFDLDAIESPRLAFAHYYDFARGFMGRDGGRVEAWSGSRWVPITPIGGYPGVIDPAAAGTGSPVPGFTGASPGGFVTSTFDLSGVLEAGARVTRIRFRVFVEGDVGPTGRGWFIDDLTVSGTLDCRRGRLAFERDPLTCRAESVDLSLHDRDLDLDPSTPDEVQVLVASTGGPAPLALTLVENGPSSGRFLASVPLAPGGQPGALRVDAGDTLTATYQDADDGTGSPRTALASVDVAGCGGPTISRFAMAPSGADAVVLRWTTDVPSTGSATLSTGGGSADRTAADFRLATSHTLKIHGLSPCSTYTVTLSSTDANGLTTTVSGPADGLIVEPPDRAIIFSDDMEGADPGWTVTGITIEWERGAPIEGPPSAFSGARVYGTDLDGAYDGGTNATLWSPPIDLTGVPSARLVFWHWYDIFASDPPNSTDDSAWLEVAVDGVTAPVYVLPIEGYPDTTDSENGEPMAEGTPVFSGQTEDWERAEFDLSPFAGKVIRIRFRIWNDLVELLLNGITGDGWYLDDVEVSSLEYCFAAPVATALSAPPLAQGGQASGAIVRGTGFRPGATVSLGNGVTVSSVSYISPEEIAIDIAVDPRATLGARTLTVINPDRQAATLHDALQLAFSPARADINGSGRVDGVDLVVLAGAFGSDEGSTHYVAAADLNADGYVDGLDLALMAPLFGAIVP